VKFTKDPPTVAGVWNVCTVHPPGNVFANGNYHCEPREFVLRGDVWYCEHPAMPGGFDVWSSMVMPGRDYMREDVTP
jgi:hypothetical protein